jgi:hypothetical protein
MRTAERVGLVTDPDGFAPVRRRTVRKWGSSKLGDTIAGKQERRAKTQATPRKSTTARQRRRVRRGAVRKPPT